MEELLEMIKRSVVNAGVWLASNEWGCWIAASAMTVPVIVTADARVFLAELVGIIVGALLTLGVAVNMIDGNNS